MRLWALALAACCSVVAVACDGQGAGSDSASNAASGSDSASDSASNAASNAASASKATSKLESASSSGSDSTSASVPANKTAGLPSIKALPDPRSIRDSPKGLINGDWAPALNHLDLVSNEPFSLGALVGPEAVSPRGAVVVSFTASWCGPCRASLPYLKQMEEQFSELDVVLVTMDQDKSGRDKELSQLAASGLDAPLVMPDSDSLRAWLGRRRNIPHLYIINAAGEVLVQDRGFGKKVRKVLPRQISYALRHPDYVVRAKKVR